MKSIAARYDGRSPSASQMRKHSHRSLRGRITHDMHVLDVGSGAGDVAILAADMVGPTGAVVGIDRNEDVLAVARERARAASGRCQLSYSSRDSTSLGGAPMTSGNSLTIGVP